MSSTLTSTPEVSGRPHRKGDLLAGLSQTLNSVAENPKVFLALIAVVLVGVAGVTFLSKQKDSKAEAARGAFYQAQKTYTDEMKALIAAEKPAESTKEKAQNKKDKKNPQQEEQASAQAVLYKKFDVDTKLPGAVSKYKAVATEFQGTMSAADAALALGDLYYAHGEPAKAVTWYEKASQGSSTLFDRSLALSSLGYALEGSGKYADAIAAFEKAINQGEASLKGDLLLAVARCKESLKDFASAKATYDKILSQMAGTEYAKKAELFKSQLE